MLLSWQLGSCADAGVLPQSDISSSGSSKHEESAGSAPPLISSSEPSLPMKLLKQLITLHDMDHCILQISACEGRYYGLFSLIKKLPQQRVMQQRMVAVKGGILTAKS